MRGDPRSRRACGGAARFRSTPLHEGRLAERRHAALVLSFRSTPLHEGRLSPLGYWVPSWLFRSTPLHLARLSKKTGSILMPMVSSEEHSHDLQSIMRI